MKPKRRVQSLVYALWRPEARTALTQAFKEKYGISVEFSPFSRGTEILAKVQAEQRAGLYTADVFGAGGGTLIASMKPEGVLEQIEPLLMLPEVTDSKYWSGGKFPFVDKNKTSVAMIASMLYILYNTDLIRKGEITTYKDLLKPQYKGKITVNDPTVTGAGNAFLTHLTMDIWNFEFAFGLAASEKADHCPVFIETEKEGKHMPEKDITSLRKTLDFLKDKGELFTVKPEVNPILEISGIQKALENGPALLFENILGYPGVRDVGNLFSRRDRAAMIFGVDSPRALKFKCVESMRHPLRPREVTEAPCQEVVIKENIDVMATLPILKHTERDGARILGGGNTFVSGKYFRGGTHVSFNRMNFRGKDWSSISFGSGNHLEWVAFIEHRGETIPMTINIGTPPAVILAAAAGFLHPIVPIGADELGFAGALQGTPVEIVKAKTVDAHAIAQSEWVLEGYVDTRERAWETDEAEKEGRIGVAPFFPEWTGYLGRAYRLLKFHVTAVTHRRDRPIFYSPLANSFENDVAGAFFREACFLELADRLRPGLVQDVNIFEGVAGWAGHVVFQVRKARRADEGHQRNILTGALNAAQGLRLAIAVDEDVDIYSPEDVFWALTTRLSPSTGIIRVAAGGMGQALMPMERVGIAVQASEEIHHEGGLGLDATVPFEGKWNFERARHPVDKTDLRKWFTDQELASVRQRQSQYGRLMSQKG